VKVVPRVALEPLDSLGRARVALGAIFLLRTTPLLSPLHIFFLADVRPLLGWPDGHLHFAPVVAQIPDAALGVLCIVRTVAALAFTIGIATRPAGLIAGALGYVTVMQNPGRLNTTEHVLFLGTMLLAVTDAASRCALFPAPVRSPRSSLFLMRIWIASIYFWAGLSKLRIDWLDGRALGLFSHDGLVRPGLGEVLLATPTHRAIIGSGVAATELALAVMLSLPRTRRLALFVALAVHTAFEVVVAPDLFGWAMAALLLSFWEPRQHASGGVIAVGVQ
jgi:hypothetical protein